jgi:hypothetical protein
MSQNRTDISITGNQVRTQAAGDIIMSQIKLTAVSVAGASLLTAAAVLSGAISRTGPAAGYIDTFPDAAQICAACPDLNVGDSFELLFINTVAFANTPAVGLGIVLGANTPIAASAVRRLLFTALSIGVNNIAAVSTTNASAVISGIAATDLAKMAVGMGITGTGIPASTTILGINGTTGTITLSAAATATATLVAVTTFPRIQVDGLMAGTL